MNIRGLVTELVLMGMSLCALEINNFVERDGFPVLVPSVQRLVRHEGAFAMPKQVRVAVPVGEEADVTLLGKALSGRFGQWHATMTTNEEPAHFTLALTEDGVPLSPQGYTLDVTADGVSLKARTPQGLFYGCHTLINLMTNNITTHIPCCHIEDWPDLEYRGAFLDIRWMANEQVDGFCRLIDAFGALKLNAMEISFCVNLPLENSPFTEPKTKLSRESLEKIKERAKANYIEIIPHLQVISHDQWLRTHPAYMTDITSTPTYPGQYNATWNTTICFAKPLGRQLTDMVIQETIKLLQPKHFHLCMDEFTLCDWRGCATCKEGHTLQQLLDEVLHNINLVKSLGVQPIIYHDTLLAPRSRDAEMSAALMAAVPRDTVMSIWDYDEAPNENHFDEFRRQGFGDRVGVSFCYKLLNTTTMPLMAKKLGGRGTILTYWGFLHNAFAVDSHVNPNSAAATSVTAEYAWHASGDTPLTALTWDPAYEMRKRLEGVVSMQRPGVPRQPIPLTAFYNARIGDDYSFPILEPADAQALAKSAASSRDGFHIQLTADGGIAAVTLSGGADLYAKAPVTIPLNGKMDGISLLVTGGIPDKPQDYDYYHALASPTVADLVVTYANGQTVSAPLRYKLEFSDWNSESSGFRSRFVLRGNDAKGHSMSFYAVDWNNPQPQEPIASMAIQPVNKGGVALAVIAANAVNPTAYNPTIGTLPNVLVSAGRGKALDPNDIHVLADFENGMPGCTVRVEGRFDDAPQYHIIDDPTAPEDGKKVLEIIVPPQSKGVNSWARAILDIELPPNPGKVLTLFADYSLSNPKANAHSGFYRTDRAMDRYYVLYDFPCTDTPNAWQHCTALSINQILTGNDLPLEELTTIRFSIWFENYDEPLRLRIDNVGYIDKDDKWTWPLRSDKLGK